jgi:hypothetical protein
MSREYWASTPVAPCFSMPVTVLSLSMNFNYVCRPHMIGNVFPQQHACQVLLDSSIASASFEVFETNS